MGLTINGTAFLEGPADSVAGSKIELINDGHSSWPWTLRLGSLSIALTDEQLERLNRVVVHRGRPVDDATLLGLDADAIEREGLDPLTRTLVDEEIEQCPARHLRGGGWLECNNVAGHDGPHDWTTIQ